jgi:uncharacterized FlaG/YvyC family protein
MDFDLRTAITLGGVIFAALTAWFTSKFGQEANTKAIQKQDKEHVEFKEDIAKAHKEHKEDIEKLKKELEARVANVGAGVDKNAASIAHTDGQQWQKLDELAQKIIAVEGATNRHEAVLDPKMMGDYREKRARMDVELEVLRRDMDKLMGRCDGRNCATEKI